MNNQSSSSMFYYPQGIVDFNRMDNNNHTNPLHLSNIFRRKITTGIPPIQNNYSNHYLYSQQEQQGFYNVNGNNNSSGGGGGGIGIVDNGNDDVVVNGEGNVPVSTRVVGKDELEEEEEKGIGGNGKKRKRTTTTSNSNENLNSSNDATQDNESSYHYLNHGMMEMIEKHLKGILAAMPLAPLPVFVPPNTDDANINSEINKLIPSYLQQQQQQQ